MINENIINNNLKEYSKNWSILSDEYLNNNIYSWLIQNINIKLQTVLEIGCGNGNGTITLSSCAKKVISIDDNIECLKKAYKKLKAKNINVKLIQRGHLNIEKEKLFTIFYSKVDLNKYKDYQVILIEGDILYDNKLITALEKSFKFDLVACWFIGTNTMKPNNKNIKKDNIFNDQQYREKVQKSLFDIYTKIKSEYGVLHIADRLGEVSLDDLIEHYNHLLNVCIKRENINLKEFNIDNQSGILFTDSDSGEVVNTNKMNYVSCLVDVV